VHSRDGDGVFGIGRRAAVVVGSARVCVCMSIVVVLISWATGHAPWNRAPKVVPCAARQDHKMCERKNARARERESESESEGESESERERDEGAK